jgi:hypothetical protein
MASSKVPLSLKNCFKGQSKSLLSVSLSLLVSSKPNKMANLCG